MPGFSAAMIPALRLPYAEINRRVGVLKDLLDPATGADLEFQITGGPVCRLHLDLRHRTAHACGGVLRANGVAGNPTVTSNATDANTASTVVARDASGNFAAGTITAALSGNASSATKLATARAIARAVRWLWRLRAWAGWRGASDVVVGAPVLAAGEPSGAAATPRTGGVAPRRGAA